MEYLPNVLLLVLCYGCLYSFAQQSTSTPDYPYVSFITDSTVQVYRGDGFKLRCEAQGYPKPTVKWFKDNHRLNDTERRRLYSEKSHKVVELFYSEYFDSGTYECVVSNYLGNSSEYVDVNVYGPPEIVDYSPSPLGVERGDMFDIYCHEEGDPVPKITWTKNGIPLQINNYSHPYSADRGRILGFSVSNTSDSGRYECKFKNSHGNTSHVIDVVVGEHPFIRYVSKRKQITTVGSVLQLHCVGDGQPEPNIIWRKRNTILYPNNRMKFSNGSQIMEIINITSAYSGNYSCSLINAVGQDEKHIELEVFDAGSIQWTGWQGWACTSCGGSCDGTQICRRQRTCIGTSSAPGICNGVQEELSAIDCCSAYQPFWNEWSSWYCSNCSKACDVGTETCYRYRTCNYTGALPSVGGSCKGNATETQTFDCNMQPCSGQMPFWNMWGNWNCLRCSKSCDGGTKICYRYRTCNFTSTTQANVFCNGNDTDTRYSDCNTNTCTGFFSTTSVSSTSTTNTPSTTTVSGGGSSSPVGLVAGAVGGGVAVILIIVVAVVCVLRRNTEPKTSKRSDSSTVPPVNKGKPFSERKRQSSHVYDQIQHGNEDENVYSTIDDYRKYTEIKDVVQDRPKYIELIAGDGASPSVAYNSGVYVNPGYTLDGSQKIEGTQNNVPGSQNTRQQSINGQQNRESSAPFYHTLEQERL